jgi:hypothetical protein
MRRLAWLCAIAGALIVAGVVWATTYHTITVDGNLSDFAADEKTAGDPAGDSLYAANNDLTTLYVTWDAQKLYLGFEFKANNTAVMVLVETAVTGGATDFCQSAGYGGAFPGNFQSTVGLDLMVGLFADSDPTKPTIPYVYTVTATGSTDITGTTGTEAKLTETVSSTTADRVGSVEAAIPWSTIYPALSGKVPAGTKLKIAGVLRGTQDWDGLGDVSPNPSGALAQALCGTGQTTVVDRFHEVTVDANNDGVPDPGRSPAMVPDGGPSPDSKPVADSKVSDLHPSADHPAPKKDGPSPRKDGVAPSGDTGRGEIAARGDAISRVDKRVTKTDAGAKKDAPAQEGCACSVDSVDARGSTALPLLGLLLPLLVARVRRRRRSGHPGRPRDTDRRPAITPRMNQALGRCHRGGVDLSR